MFNADAQLFEEETGLVLTRHAWKRMGARGISREFAHAALTYGRRVHSRGAVIYVIGRKEIARAMKRGIDLLGLNGVQVVCDARGERVLTTYRNRDLRGLRPRRRYRYGAAT